MIQIVVAQIALQ